MEENKIVRSKLVFSFFPEDLEKVKGWFGEDAKIIWSSCKWGKLGYVLLETEEQRNRAWHS